MSETKKEFVDLALQKKDEKSRNHHKATVPPATWIEIANLARQGIPVVRIAKMFKLDASNIRRHLKSRGIQHGEGLITKAEDEAKKERENLIVKIKKVKEEELQLNEYVSKRTIKVLMEAEKANQKFSTVYHDVKTLKLAADILSTTMNSKWKVLGLDKENDESDKYVPDLSIREMTMDEINKIKNRSTMSDDDEGFSQEEIDRLELALENEVVLEGNSDDDDDDFEDWGGGNDK